MRLGQKRSQATQVRALTLPGFWGWFGVITTIANYFAVGKVVCKKRSAV